MTFDIIRRVLSDYFGYEIFFVQNVTDIDDKIIKRARSNYLFNRYLERVKNGSIKREDVLKDVKDGLDLLKIKISKESDVAIRDMISKQIKRVEEVLKTSTGDTPLESIVTESGDIISEIEDKRHGKDVKDNSIFETLPKKFEEKYNQDMEALNVLKPDAVTRVTQYVPEIVSYIQVIIEKKYAYVSNGSVYFDVKAFSENDHIYAKMVHEAIGDEKILNEGEGDLFLNQQMSEKKSHADFVLWKKSKDGEPVYPSPWGLGRPGWHIECSVMASILLGQAIDIHSGGIDLRFPHHDNEMAQSEAYYDDPERKGWINYFLHSGHLTIDGQKMSKSLKNFTTIKKALEDNTSRELRLTFLLHNWKETLNYSKDTITDAVVYLKYVNNFFLNVKDMLRGQSSGLEIQKWGQKEIDLNSKYLDTIDSVDESLCDNIDTKSSLDALKDLVNACNIYMRGHSDPNGHLVKTIANYVAKILKIFGVYDENSSEISFDTIRTSSSETNHLNMEQILMPHLNVLAKFREEIRSRGIELKDQQILKLCDDLRDEILPNLGVRLEDRESNAQGSNSKTVLKLVSKEQLLKEKMEKMKIEEEKMREKEKRKREVEEKERKNKLSPVDWAKEEFTPDKYSAFDERVCHVYLVMCDT